MEPRAQKRSRSSGSLAVCHRRAAARRTAKFGATGAEKPLSACRFFLGAAAAAPCNGARRRHLVLHLLRPAADVAAAPGATGGTGILRSPRMLGKITWPILLRLQLRKDGVRSHEQRCTRSLPRAVTGGAIPVFTHSAAPLCCAASAAKSTCCSWLSSSWSS